MMNVEKSILKEKSFAFAIRIVRLFKHLIENKREFVMSKQLLRSGTAIGALVREAQNAESKMDFVHKLSISQKESDETIYWLELLKATEYLMENELKSMAEEAEAILRMIISSILTVKQNLKK